MSHCDCTLFAFGVAGSGSVKRGKVGEWDGKGGTLSNPKSKIPKSWLLCLKR